MAILNFPPTAGEPTDGSFTYEDNGVLYSWDGYKWEANSDSGFDSKYVEVTGDNMTGNLTLGTDKIELNASNGSATFDGTLKTNNFFYNTNSSGGLGVAVYNNSGSSSDKIAIAVADNASGSPKSIELKYDGSITAAGDVAIGDNSVTFADKLAVIAALSEEQRTTFAAAITAWNNRPEPYDAEDPTTLPADLPLREAIVRATTAGKINLNANDGSASFAGPVKHTGYDSDYGCNLYTDGANQGGLFAKATSANGLLPVQGTAFSATWDGADVARIRYDGSASFAGYIESTRYTNRAALSTNVNGTDYGFAVYDGNSNLYAGIATDGSASFAGGEATINEGGKLDLGVSKGQVLVRADDLSSTAQAFAVYNGSWNVADEVVRISHDGTASFLGRVYSTRVAGTSCFQAYTTGDAQAKIDLVSNGNATFVGTVTENATRSGSVEILLEADDDTKYTSTTDSEGNVNRVYNGAVLDVKERIQNVLARMDAIEANEVTDDATDSALLSLVASLSARLDERDAQIAALTARVTTLES